MSDILLEIARAIDYNRDDIRRIQASQLGSADSRGHRVQTLSEANEFLRQAKVLVMRAEVKRDDYEKIK